MKQLSLPIKSSYRLRAENLARIASERGHYGFVGMSLEKIADHLEPFLIKGEFFHVAADGFLQHAEREDTW